METKELSFQQKMNRLNQIVDALNKPDLELEKAMALFKEGLKLSRECEDQLAKFETELNELIVEEDD